MNEHVTNYIEEASDEQKVIMKKIRQLIKKAVPSVEENFKWGRPIFTATKDFAYLKTAKAYVTLGFFNFEKIKNDLHLLEGTGKDMRHIKIKKASDIDSELLTKWFTILSK
jgi:hypothetical protein